MSNRNRKKGIPEQLARPLPIQAWRHKDAPIELQNLCDDGGDEEWITLIPAAYVSFCDLDGKLKGGGEGQIRIYGLGTLHGRLVRTYDGSILLAWSH